MKGDRINLYNDRWIQNLEPLRALISGPLNRGEESRTLATYLLNGHLNPNSLSFKLPNSLVSSINSIISNVNPLIIDKMV